MKKLTKYFFIAIILFLANNNCYPQSKEGTTIDKIIAVVGNEIITLSDLNSQLAVMYQNDKTVDFNSMELKRKVLDAMINEKLIITKAIEDSVVVTDEEIKQGWEEFLSNAVRYYGSEKRIEDIYGMSISRLQADRKDDIRKQLLAKNLFRQKFGELKVSPRELDEFFNNFKDSLPVIPQQIELYHIVKLISANANQKEDILKLALKVRDSLVMGGNFSDFAKNYSADPGTKNNGGELGWFERGKLVKEFENAAFALLKNEISKPIESPFGFHIIQLIDKNKDSVNTRHILFRIGQSSEDKEIVKKYLLDVKNRIQKGESFESMAKQYSDEKETQGFGGLIGKFPVNNIPPAIKDAIEKLPEGGISDPMPFGQEPKASFHIIWKKRIIPEHKASLKDDNKEIEQMASNYKQNKAYLEWIESLKKTVYWEVKL